MKWEILKAKWMRKKGEKIKVKEQKRLRKEDLKNVLYDLHRAIRIDPKREFYRVSCNFQETAIALEKKGFTVEYYTKVQFPTAYWYNVSWKE